MDRTYCSRNESYYLFLTFPDRRVSQYGGKLTWTCATWPVCMCSMLEAAYLWFNLTHHNGLKDLPHGQLYVAFSRVKCSSSVAVYVNNEDRFTKKKKKNCIQRGFCIMTIVEKMCCLKLFTYSMFMGIKLQKDIMFTYKQSE